MAHNINSMMYTGEKPWHGLGTKLENVATAAEAIAAAGLNWTVTKEPVFLKDGREVADTFATMRSDNKDVLGTVGAVYRPLQNKEAFSFFDAIVGEKLAMYHTAGALGVGERVWILAKLPGTVRVIGDDITEKFLLLTNTHDGSSSVQMMFSPIRVVCQNTLNIALGSGIRNQKMRHTNTLGLRVSEIRAGLGIVHERFQLFEEMAQALTRVNLKSDDWRTYCRNIGIIPADEFDKMSTRAKNILEEVTSLFEYGKGNNAPGVKGTAWAAFNAITEWTDHARATKGENKEQARASSLLFGSGAAIKQKAWDAATALIA